MSEENSLDPKKKERVIDWVRQRCGSSVDQVIYKAMQDQKVFLIMASFGLDLEEEILLGIVQSCEERLKQRREK